MRKPYMLANLEQEETTYERYATVIESDIYNKGAVQIAKDDTRTIVNLRVEQSLLDKKMKVYVFGNDITNTGKIEDTDDIRNATLSQIGAMYGLGLSYTFK